MTRRTDFFTFQKFITYNAETPDISIDDTVVGHAYGQASSFYVRQGDYVKARSYLEEGLKFSPFNEELNRKLLVLKDYR